MMTLITVLALLCVNILTAKGQRAYTSLGCYKDTANRAIPTLEGQDPLLDGSYPSRHNAIQKCYQAAFKRGYTVFAVQHGGWCASSPTARQTYKKYGRSTACRGDGEGGPWANQVYEIIGKYSSLGCYKDTGSRAIPTLEGQDPLLDGRYRSRHNAIQKCFQAALKHGYKVFAVQDGGWCASSPIAKQTYNKYGRSTACLRDGEGGGWANQVYKIEGDQILAYSSLGCFRDNGNLAIPTLEGRDSLLDGAYKSRKDAVNKCYRAALARGYKVFAVQDGGWCASSPTAEQTYDKYGISTACRGDGEGGPWANRVYEIGGQCHTQ